jgi:hypothetical protein
MKNVGFFGQKKKCKFATNSQSTLVTPFQKKNAFCRENQRRGVCLYHSYHTLVNPKISGYNNISFQLE